MLDATRRGPNRCEAVVVLGAGAEEHGGAEAHLSPATRKFRQERVVGVAGVVVVVEVVGTVAFRGQALTVELAGWAAVILCCLSAQSQY